MLSGSSARWVCLVAVLQARWLKRITSGDLPARFVYQPGRVWHSFRVKRQGPATIITTTTTTTTTHRSLSSSSSLLLWLSDPDTKSSNSSSDSGRCMSGRRVRGFFHPPKVWSCSGVWVTPPPPLPFGTMGANSFYARVSGPTGCPVLQPPKSRFHWRLLPELTSVLHHPPGGPVRGWAGRFCALRWLAERNHQSWWKWESVWPPLVLSHYDDKIRYRYKTRLTVGLSTQEFPVMTIFELKMVISSVPLELPKSKCPPCLNM